MIKKIGVFLETGPATGGVYQYNRLIVDSLDNLDKNKFEVIAYYSGKHWVPILAEKRMKAVEYQSNFFWHKLPGLYKRLKLPIRLWRSTIAWFHPLMRLMKKDNCKFCIFPSEDAYSYLLPIQSMSTIHDLMHLFESRFPEVGNAKEVKNRNYRYSLMCRFSQKILVDSRLGKQQVIDSFNVTHNKIRVLPYVANPYLNHLNEINIKEKYNLPSKFIFYPAQFWQHKNHVNLIKALHKNKEAGLEIHLVLTGAPKNGYQTVLDLINTLKLNQNVHLLGLIEDSELALLYRSAQALIMPTFFGPTNLPPLEAFSLSCPVAVSGIYAMPEQLKEAAIYFDPNSVEEIASVMKELWCNDALCQDLIKKGQLHYQQWNHKHFKEKLNQILESVI